LEEKADSQVVWTFMTRWWEAEGREMFAEESNGGLRILDMAAGRSVSPFHIFGKRADVIVEKRPFVYWSGKRQARFVLELRGLRSPKG
jgi:hypothetical protein